MNRMLLKLFFLALTLISSNALSSEPRFELTIGALLLQPSGTNLDYAVLGYPLPVQSPHWDVQSVQPGYSLGFSLGGRYFIQNTKNDLALSWDHLNTSDTDSTQAGASQFVVLEFQAGPSAGQSFNNPSQRAVATAKFNYDVINLDVGHYIDLNTATQFRLFVGFSGAELKENLSATFQDNGSTYSLNSTNNSRFDGVGPLVGIDGLYRVPCNIGIFGAISTSALIGNINSKTTYVARSPELASAGISTNFQSITPKNLTQIVPGISGKIGLNYTYSYINSFLMTVALGYEYVNYFNANVFYNPTVVFGNVNTGTIALSSLGKSVSNYALSGPIFTVDFKFL